MDIREFQDFCRSGSRKPLAPGCFNCCCAWKYSLGGHPQKLIDFTSIMVNSIKQGPEAFFQNNTGVSFLSLHSNHPTSMSLGAAMIPEIKKILFATDLSENARFAFGYAASLANRYGAQIVMLNVIEEIPQQMHLQLEDLLGMEKWRELQQTRKKEVLENLAGKIKAFCAETAAADQSCPFTVTDIKVRNGHPVEEIIAESIASDYDVIVMGTHGHGILAGAMMGSTAMRVVRRSHVPVMVIRLPKSA